MDCIKKFLSVFLISIFLIFVWPASIAVCSVSELLNKSEKRVYLNFWKKGRGILMHTVFSNSSNYWFIDSKVYS